MNRETSLFLKSLQLDGIDEIYGFKTSAPKAAAVKKSGKTVATAETKTSLPASTEDNRRSRMIELREETLSCTKCSELCAERTKVVFGSGNIHTDLVFVGEAPGRDEDLQGLPFVGAAGQLLTKIIEAIGYKRDDVFICNVLKCRPPQNRSPKPDEIINCRPFLERQLDLIQPKMICALGNFAAQTLLETDQPMAKLRQKFHEYRGIKVTCTYHPAYLLRNPADKRKVWEDMKMMKREIEGSSS